MQALAAKGETALPELRKAFAGSTDPDVKLRLCVVMRRVIAEVNGPVRTFDGHTDRVVCVAYRPDGKVAAWYPGSEWQPAEVAARMKQMIR